MERSVAGLLAQAARVGGLRRWLTNSMSFARQRLLRSEPLT